MPSKAWKPVRLTSATLEQINAIKEQLQRGAEQGKRTIEYGPKGEIPIDFVVRTIAAAWLSHRSRSNRPRRLPAAAPDAAPPATAAAAAGLACAAQSDSQPAA